MNHTSYYFGNLRSIHHHTHIQLSGAILAAYPHLDPHNAQDAFALHRHHSHATDRAKTAAFNRWKRFYNRDNKYTGRGTLAANPATIASQIAVTTDWRFVTLFR